MFEHRADSTQRMRWIILPLVINQVGILKRFQTFVLLPCLGNDNICVEFCDDFQSAVALLCRVQELGGVSAPWWPCTSLCALFCWLIEAAVLRRFTWRRARRQMEGVTVRWRLSVMRHQVAAIETLFIWQVKRWSRQKKPTDSISFCSQMKARLSSEERNDTHLDCNKHRHNTKHNRKQRNFLCKLCVFWVLLCPKY